jgi:parvulin-like peptidyl-prolyl isomerase
MPFKNIEVRMSKGNTESAPKLISKKHEARLEKEGRQKKILLIGVIAILALVVFLVVYGILDSTVLKQSKPVAKVNSTTITVREFEKRVQYERLSQIETFSMYASSPYAMFFQDSLITVQNALDNYIQFGSDMLDTMIDEAVITEKAKELGITVTDEDINKEIERGFGFYPNGTPTAAPTIEFLPTSTFSPTQLALVTLTPTPTLEPTATAMPATPTVGTTNTEAATPTVATSSSEAATATVIPPTATPYTQAGFESSYQTMINSINEKFPYTDADFKEYVRSLLINQKVFEYVNKDATQNQEMVWARHILVSTEEEAKSVLENLAKGQDWSIVAAGFSIDTGTASNGGDLGWFYRGKMVEAFETEAFKLKIGEISQPVKTDFGYHIIQVLGHEVRQLTDDEFTTMKSTAFNKFIADSKAEMNVKKYDVWASVVPNSPSIPTELRIDTSATAQ